MIRILVAEDMRILRDMLVSMLNLEDDVKVVAQVADGTGIVPAALAERPDLAVLDIDMPGLDGLTAAAELHERLPGCRVVILTVLGRPGQLRRALAAHVSGFLVKDTPSVQLAGVLRRVAAGERVIDPKLALAALEMKESPLSEREADVLRRFAAGADGLSAAVELAGPLPDCRVIVLTAFGTPDMRLRAAAAGVWRFLLKEVPAQTLLDAVRPAARDAEAGSRRPR